LERLDVLPVGDLGIQKGFKVLYGLRSLPTQNRMEALAKPWRQYASVASWYLWKVADEDKEKFKKKN
jgi:DNA-3-methyladenine glycosylase II